MRGDRTVRIAAQVEKISTKLCNFKCFIPACFARKPRGLTEIDGWRAIQFRQFLLYTGKVVLNDILRADLYGSLPT